MEDGHERFKTDIRRVLLPLLIRVSLRRQEYFVNVIAQILELELARKAKGGRHSKLQAIIGSAEIFDAGPNSEAVF
jgi:hypothetical protein